MECGWFSVPAFPSQSLWWVTRGCTRRSLSPSSSFSRRSSPAVSTYIYIYIYNKCHCDVRVNEMNRSAESIDSGGDAWCYYMQLLRFVVYYIYGVCRSVRHRNSARRMVFWKKYIYIYGWISRGFDNERNVRARARTFESAERMGLLTLRWIRKIFKIDFFFSFLLRFLYRDVYTFSYRLSDMWHSYSCTWIMRNVEFLKRRNIS